MKKTLQESPQNLQKANMKRRISEGNLVEEGNFGS